jgi:hypothetical protein
LRETRRVRRCRCCRGATWADCRGA